MASLPSSDITNCGVCFEPYSTSSGSEHIPLCLPPPCGHTFCLACCRALIKRKRVLCPECRCSSSVNSVNDLLRNFTMMAFLDEAASSQSRRAAAEEEEDNKRALLMPVSNERCANHVDGCSAKASIYCKECTVCLCEECATTAHKIGFMKSHKLGPMSERQVRCPVHSDQICDLVVADSQQVICLKCQYGNFKNKRVRPIEEVSAEVMAELNKQLPALSSMINALTTQQATLTGDVQSIRDSAAACHEQVTTTFQILEEMIAARKIKLNHDIEMFEQEQIQAAEDRVKANLERTASMVKLEERIKLLASGSSDKVTLVSSFADLRAELKTQEASVTQLLNQAGANMMLSLRQDVDAVRKQLNSFVSLKRQTNASPQIMFTGFISNIPLKAETPEEIEAKKLKDDGTINQITVGNDNDTPLTKAVMDNYLDMVKALIKFGADVNGKDGDRWTPLHKASYKGHVEVVKVLLAAEGIDVNAKIKTGLTALSLAISKSHPEIVAMLRSAGAVKEKVEKDIYMGMFGDY